MQRERLSRQVMSERRYQDSVVGLLQTVCYIRTEIHPITAKYLYCHACQKSERTRKFEPSAMLDVAVNVVLVSSRYLST